MPDPTNLGRGPVRAGLALALQPAGARSGFRAFGRRKPNLTLRRWNARVVIRVTVEMWPGGDASKATLLGEIAIVNVTPRDDPAAYVVAVIDASGELGCSHVVPEHRRSVGWAELVSRSLAASTVDNSDRVEELTTKFVEHLKNEQAGSAK
jgi:hypothetical protein